MRAWRFLEAGVVVALLVLIVGLGLSLTLSGSAPAAGVQAQTQTQPPEAPFFTAVTVGRLVGIRFDAAQPTGGVPESGLILGLGADLTVLAGNVAVKRASQLAQGLTGATESGGRFTQGVYCYLVTSFIDGKEAIQQEVLRLAVEGGQQVVLRWKVAPELRQAVKFGARAGYRVYRAGPLADSKAPCPELGQYGRLAELPVEDPEREALSFVDSGQLSLGSPPQLKDTGNLTVEGNAEVGGNAEIKLTLTVGALTRTSQLVVGDGPVPARKGEAWVDGGLTVGPGGVIPAAPPAPAAAAALLRWVPPGPFKQWDLVAAQAPLPPLPQPTVAGAAGVFALLERFPQPVGAALTRLELTSPPGNWKINLGQPLLPGNPPNVPPTLPTPGSFTIADLAAPAAPRLQINDAGNVGIGVAAPCITPPAVVPAGPAGICPPGAILAPPGGNVEIAGQLRVGNFTVAPAVALGPGAMYFDSTQDALCVFTAKKGWECLSATTIINILIPILIQNVEFIQEIIKQLNINVEFRQTIINLLIANVEFRQTIVNILVQNVEFRQTVINILIANTEFRQTLINALTVNVEFRQTIVNILVADEKFKQAVMEAMLKDQQFLQALVDAVGPIFDKKYVLKAGDTIQGSLTVQKLLTAQEDLRVVKNADISGNLSVGGNIDLSGDLTIGGDLTLLGDMRGPLILRGPQRWMVSPTVRGRPNDFCIALFDPAKRDFFCKLTVTPAGDTEISDGGLSVAKDAKIGGNLSVAQFATVNQYLFADWLVVGEPGKGAELAWGIINPDKGPDLSIGPISDIATGKITPLLRLTRDGKVGIGVDQPASKLHVAGNRIRLEGNKKILDLRVDGEEVDIESQGASLILNFGQSDKQNTLMNVLAGNVGIGLRQPREKLHVNGNVQIDGNLRATGAKFFVQRHPKDPTKEILFAALEGPEVGVYIRGEAQLQDGQAVIALPEEFGLVTDEAGLTVQLTPVGEWLQLYVVELSPQKLVVREAQGKSGKFFYLVQGVRKGFESFQPVQQSKTESH